MKPIIASCLLVVAVASCKGKDKDTPKPAVVAGSATASDAAMPAVDAAGSGSAIPAPLQGEDFASPTDQAMKAAFGGAPPQLPLLARDGATAAVDLSESLGLSDMATYEVGFLDDKQRIDKVVLLDDKGAQSGGDSGEIPVTDTLKGAATALTKRLTDGGYTAFGKHVERQPEDTAAIDLGGIGKLEVTPPPASKGDEVGATPLVLSLADATGRSFVKETIKPVAAGKAQGACGGEPRLGSVWYDVPRKRVVARVYYMVGGDTCESIPAIYRMWKLP